MPPTYRSRSDDTLFTRYISPTAYDWVSLRAIMTCLASFGPTEVMSYTAYVLGPIGW